MTIGWQVWLPILMTGVWPSETRCNGLFATSQFMQWLVGDVGCSSIQALNFSCVQMEKNSAIEEEFAL